MANTDDHLIELIDELRDVLEEERRALLGGTAEAINAATQRKTIIADQIEQASFAVGAARPDRDTLITLAHYNRENAVICAAMLRHLTGAIDRLRRQAPHRSYKPDGSEQNRSLQHALGAA
jgi:hypothetical protein